MSDAWDLVPRCLPAPKETITHLGTKVFVAALDDPCCCGKAGGCGTEQVIWSKHLKLSYSALNFKHLVYRFYLNYMHFRLSACTCSFPALSVQYRPFSAKYDFTLSKHVYHIFTHHWPVTGLMFLQTSCSVVSGMFSFSFQSLLSQVVSLYCVLCLFIYLFLSLPKMNFCSLWQTTKVLSIPLNVALIFSRSLAAQAVKVFLGIKWSCTI